MSEPIRSNVENSSGLFQAIDANLNRSSEGLRVVEEVFRFVNPDKFLAKQIKQTRHLLAELAECFGSTCRNQARDGQTDVGRALSGQQEGSRESLNTLLQANFNRAAEALRVIEEFSKMVQPDIAPRCEAVRYQVYDLQKACELASSNQQLLEQIRICVLLDAQSSNETFVSCVRQLGDWPKMIQLRDKNVDDSTLVERGKILSQLVGPTKTVWLMNDRADLAVACEADGVHLGQDDLSLSDARKVVGPERMIGISTHNVEQVQTAVMDGATYVGVGPTFASRTKTFEQFSGTAFIKEVSEGFSIPAFAIGGIDETNIAQVIQAGGSRVAISQAAKNIDSLEKIREALQVEKAKQKASTTNR